jgi:epoxyqueuosine reductase
MVETIRSMICRFVEESPANRFPEDGKPYFDEPLIGYAAADDPLFHEYKRIIGEFHRTPHEVMETAFGGNMRAATVISWILPVTRPTRESNRRETAYPSPAWAHTRHFGEQFNAALRRHVTEWLAEQGHHAVAPQLEASWRECADTPVGRASTWSERHAAYAAGLGTFSLNDALITPRGIAHRCGSVITDLPLPPSPRPYPDHYYNCLYYREKSCGACIERCPAGAISHLGHDKDACSLYVHDTAAAAVAEKFGVTQTGCGLCQTRVPCEGRIPAGTAGA